MLNLLLNYFPEFPGTVVLPAFLLRKMPWKPPSLIPTTLQIAAIGQLIMQTRGEENVEIPNKTGQAQELSRDGVPLILTMLGVLVQLSVALTKTMWRFFSPPGRGT